MVLRCSACRYSHNEELPAVEKATIYLDQFVFSNIFKIKTGRRAPLGHGDFYDELIPLLRRVVLLQQALLPHSDLHVSETIVFNNARDLREAYESIGGGAALRDSREIELDQVLAFAHAFRDGSEPLLALAPDEIIRGRRNDWLSDMRISVNSDYSNFADGIRRDRDSGFAALSQATSVWANEKPAFKQQLRLELQYGNHKRNALASLRRRISTVGDNDDAMEFLSITQAPAWQEFYVLLDFFGSGTPSIEAERRVYDFWDWDRLSDMPCNRISAYLFAGLARRVGMGQRKLTPGMMTDFRAISTYGPYVDAMFIDRECALLLSEGELRHDLDYRARIFSYANKADFLAYLRGLEAQASAEVRYYADRIYGSL